MTEPQVWVFMGLFATAVFGILGWQTAVFTRLLRTTAGGIREVLEVRFTGVERRFDTLETRLDRVETRLDRVEGRLDRVESKIDGLDRDVQALTRHVFGTDRD